MQRIALVGNFPPRKCGIATFMNDLNDGITNTGVSTTVIAMNDGVKKYIYPEQVEFEIEQDEVTSYINAAGFINRSQFDAVILQHEFGIFGGRDGKHIIQLLKRLKMPVITTLHTILDTPSEGQRSVVNEIAALSKKLICISKKGIEILRDIYGIPPSKCRHIHHGVHQTGTLDTDSLRKELGVADKKVLLTFGLLSRNKSLEVVINALPRVVEKHPGTVYIILGATHPNVVKNDGEEYRHYLMDLVKKQGLENNVIFIDRFVSNEELFTFLKMCDIYVIPYLGQKQISSGTLIYAMGAGKSVVSTPFWYAEEMLAEGRGMLFNFNDFEALSDTLLHLLDHEDERETISRNALALAEQCYWPHIGKQYVDVLKRLSREDKKAEDNKSEAAKIPTPHHKTNKINGAFTLPPVNLNQLRVLTDYTGILQHALYNIPHRAHGYCIDDNARALMLSVMLQNDVTDKDMDELYRLTSIYLSFIDDAWNPDNGRFRNFKSYELQWLEEEGSEDSAGRTMWALGYTAASTDITNFHYHANYLFRRGLETIDYISYPRALAYLTLGLVNYARMYEETSIIDLLERKAGQLSAYFDESINNDEWPWFEQIVTYANSRIPQALISAGMFLHDPQLAERGTKLLNWLIEKQFTNGIFIPIGNKGWMTPDSKALYDQQPIEAHSMIDACVAAKKYTKDKKYNNYAIKAFEWFTGSNICSSMLCDFDTGGCHDGVHPDGVNLNQGAESTLSWLMSVASMSSFIHNKNKLLRYDYY